MQKIETSIAKLLQWVEKADYRAYDPGDGNNSFLHFFTFNNLLLERIIQQAVYRAPFNVRPLIGIKPHTSTKGMGYMAWGYVKMYRHTGDAAYEKKARYCLDWLTHHRSAANEFCWGNDFSFSTRAGKIPRGEPTIVWSSLIGQAFLEASKTLGDRRYFDVATSICRWILTLPREKSSTGDCLSYVAFKQSSIHNSNMLGAALLGGVGAEIKDQQMLDAAQQAMLYSCTRQRPDGSWFYGEDPKYHWIDNFHTGYNLDSLRRYIDATGDDAFNEQLTRGFDYFEKTFFEADGCPKYYHNQKYPIDIQCAAQAIDTLTFFSDRRTGSLDLGRKVADWTIDHMQARDGHFYYRDLGWAVNKTPMLHWGIGTIFKALSNLLIRLAAAEPRSPGKNGEAIPSVSTKSQNNLRYVLITAARNEEAFIPDTIRCVLNQTRRPEKWIIVSDGSTDQTDEIVRKFARDNSWIELLQMPPREQRHFGGKAICFNSARGHLNDIEYDVIGSVDADLSFDDAYFAFLLEKFAEDAKLGVAGTPFSENGVTYDFRFSSTDHVSGACQLFRRECFDQIGGYTPIKGGGIDVVAVLTARSHGWRTRTFTEKTCIHHRPMGSANDRAKIIADFKLGRRGYSLGYHPVFQVFRSVYQMSRRPYIVGGCALLCGYFWAMLKGVERPVPKHLIDLQRRDQMIRLQRFFGLRRSC